MKKYYSRVLAAFLLLPAGYVQALTLKVSKPGADEKSAPLVIESFNSNGLFVKESVRYTNGQAMVQIPANTARLYWISGLPFYLYPTDEVSITLPENKSVTLEGGMVVGKTVLSSNMLDQQVMLTGGNQKANNLLMTLVQDWAAFNKKHFGDTSTAMIAAIAAQETKSWAMVNAVATEAQLRNMATVMHYAQVLLAKSMFVSSRATVATDPSFFKTLQQVSLNDTALNQLSYNALANVTSAYYNLTRLQRKEPYATGVPRTLFILREVSNPRIVNEQAGQGITLYFRDKGMDQVLLDLLPLAKEKITNPTLLAQIAEKEKEYGGIFQGATAPAFALRNVKGETVALAGYKGKVVAIDVWATWCSGCVKELPHFIELRQAYQKDTGIVFITISIDGKQDEKRWREFLVKKGITGADLSTIWDTGNQFRKAYSITGIPRYLIIDQQGKMVVSHGPKPSSPEYRQLLQQTLHAGQAVVKATSPSLQRTDPRTNAAAAKTGYPAEWYLLSHTTDQVYGTGVKRAYQELLKNKTPEKIIVAILDSGLDTAHEDLKNVLWTNAHEIPGNGIDDDGNGYIDDIHGWNFLGSVDGRTNFDFISKEADREYLRLQQLYAGKDTQQLSATDRAYFQAVKADSRIVGAQKRLREAGVMSKAVAAIDSSLRAINKGGAYTYQQFDAQPMAAHDTDLRKAYAALQFREINTKHNPSDTIGWILPYQQRIIPEAKKEYDKQVALATPDYRSIGNATAYGNGKLSTPGAMHGTHVAGIIGADKTNAIGANGIADAVELMGVRVVPSGGDEYDEDVAKAVRYAVDNGARIINMSFGKLISPNKKVVDDAIRYAEKKNVLIVHAAGNDGMNTDLHPFYPSAWYDKAGKAANVITVGGSDAKGGIAGISNYGKRSVDLFAPSHSIYSTGASGTYFVMDGTSVAAPVVTGIAALIWSYYPNLSAVQVKHLLLETVTKTKSTPGSLPAAASSFDDLSVSGGIVNAYEALKRAATLTH